MRGEVASVSARIEGASGTKAVRSIAGAQSAKKSLGATENLRQPRQMVRSKNQMRFRGTTLIALWMCSGCASVTEKDSAVPPVQAHAWTVKEITSLIPKRVQHRKAWAEAVSHALEAHDLGRTLPRVCAVLAVIEQESGYRADPVVPGMSKLVEDRLRAYARRLGGVGEALFQELLGMRVGAEKKTIETRLRALRTERDVDRLFRDMVEHAETEFPRTLKLARWVGKQVPEVELERLNPITTAGSMQVSVRFAQQLGEGRGLTHDEVREQLYTLDGGVYYGTARLFDDEASYPESIFRFADYNAGRYASRNAALQEQLSMLTGQTLRLDGDVLAYRKDGTTLPKRTQTLDAMLRMRQLYGLKISERQIKADAHKEKSADFESTQTYRAIKRLYQKQTGTAPVYARVPELELSSPKIRRKLTTNWFASNVQRRYASCLQRAGARM